MKSVLKILSLIPLGIAVIFITIGTLCLKFGEWIISKLNKI